MKIFGIISTKGGVGKTTLTANLGAILADMGQSVLLIDADPQQTLSRYFDITEAAPFGLTQLFKASNPAKTISKRPFQVSTSLFVTIRRPTALFQGYCVSPLPTTKISVLHFARSKVSTITF